MKGIKKEKVWNKKLIENLQLIIVFIFSIAIIISELNQVVIVSALIITGTIWIIKSIDIDLNDKIAFYRMTTGLMCFLIVFIIESQFLVEQTYHFTLIGLLMIIFGIVLIIHKTTNKNSWKAIGVKFLVIGTLIGFNIKDMGLYWVQAFFTMIMVVLILETFETYQLIKEAKNSEIIIQKA